MGPSITITFTGEPDNEDIALLLEAVAGELRRGNTSGLAEEYSWKIV
jgi:hypothetical protein